MKEIGEGYQEDYVGRVEEDVEEGDESEEEEGGMSGEEGWEGGREGVPVVCPGQKEHGQEEVGREAEKGEAGADDPKEQIADREERPPLVAAHFQLEDVRVAVEGESHEVRKDTPAKKL